MKISKNSPILLAGGGEVAILKYTDTLCSSEECHPSREIVLPDPKLLDYYQSLTDQGESKYPTPAPPPSFTPLT